MIKTYAYKGVSNVVMEVKAGNNNIRFEFSGGNLNTKQKIDATYTTDNVIRQYLIEHTDKYLNGKIYIKTQLEKKVDEEGNVTLVEAEDPIIEVTEVTSKNEAIEYLKGLGVKATNLRSENRIREQASIKRVSFPNWKEEEKED